MKKLVIYVLFLTKASLVLGTGVCSSTTDYCPEPVGLAAINATLVESGRHSIEFEVMHLSEIEDENKDRGTEHYIIKYRWEFYRR